MKDSRRRNTEEGESQKDRELGKEICEGTS